MMRGNFRTPSSKTVPLIVVDYNWLRVYGTRDKGALLLSSNVRFI